MFSAQQFPMITPQMTQGAQEAGQQTANMIQQGVMFPQMYQQMANQNALLGEQAQYYPQTAQAEIAQKLAESGYLGSESQMNQYMMQNPNLISPEGYLYGMAFGGKSPGGMSGIQGTPGMGGIPPQGGMQPGSQSPPQGGGQPGMQQPGLGSPATGGGWYGAPQYTANSALNSKLQQLIDPMGYQIRLAQQEANIPYTNQLLQESNQSAINANKIDMDLDNMQANYPKISNLQKGGIFGFLPAGTSSAVQNFDSAASDVSGNIARAMNSGHITNQDYQQYNNVFAARKSNPQSFQQYVDYTKALNSRIAEYPQALLAATHAGMPPQYFQADWTRYLNERPVYDFKAQQVIPGNQNSFIHDYLNQNAVNAVLTGQPYSPRTSVKQLSQQQGNQPENQGSTNGASQNVSTAALQNSPAAQQNGISQVNMAPGTQTAPINQNTANSSANSLAHSMQLPSFPNKAAFQAYYSKQPAMVQKAIRLSLGAQQ